MRMKSDKCSDCGNDIYYVLKQEHDIHVSCVDCGLTRHHILENFNRYD